MEENNVKVMLEEAIKGELEGLSDLEQGSKEHSIAIENLNILYRLRIDETKNEWDYGEKYESHEREERLKKEQLAEQVRDRYFRLGLEAAGLLLPLVFYASWMRKGFRFEETGTFTSATFRGLFNRFKPTQK